MCHHPGLLGGTSITDFFVTLPAVAIAAADSLLDFIYFPPGVYRVSISIQVEKPIIVGKWSATKLAITVA